MKNFKKKFPFLTATLCIGLNFSINISATENASRLGQLHGKILTLSGTDVTSVIIQVVGANERDSFISYTTPDANGEFNFDGILPAGSVVQLYFWDSNGVLNRTVLNAYVSFMNSNTVGTYEVTMHDTQYTYDLSEIYNTSHEITNTGLCGFVGGDARGTLSGVRVVAYDRMARYAGPLAEQNIDENGKFCFFNLTSPSRTDLYDFFLFDAYGEKTTFTFDLPPGTFIHDVYFDAKSALYRAPVFNSSLAVNFATSDDYDSVMADGSLAYFPLSNELLEIPYNVGNPNQNHFFILFPRTQLFQNSKARVASQSGSQQIYLDDAQSLPLKFLTEDELINLNANLYFQTWNEKFGSVFVDLDLSQFGIQNSTDVQLSLRNGAGKDVGVFEKLSTQNFSGYFLNIFPGVYHLFLTTLDGQILWTYEIRSYPNRLQMLVNDVNPLKSIPRTPSEFSKDSLLSNALNSEIPEIFGMYGLLNTETSVELNALRNESRFVATNMLYQRDANDLCKKTAPPKILEKLLQLH